MTDVNDRTSRRLAAIGALLVPWTVLCVFYLDIPVAVFVRDYLYANRHWVRATAELPDLLLAVVVVATVGSCLLYLFRYGRGILDRATMLAKEVVWLAPVSYLVKALLKIAFGRSNTRYWLHEPGDYGFHWFQMKEYCDGFPSGHMLVIVALLAAVWRFYPESRPIGIVTAILLAAALVATNYHFLSDVVVGAYLAILLEVMVSRLIFCRRRTSAN
ncbi:phosphatase PAP2 family protein [Geomonas sp. Red69]|uniref:Phosphatase PAP2 family protein n=1 Tax=Geomonas diazotrophica TaxID=2843197 RepID=A0ABX8JN73_9BACT|nr:MULTISPECIES: phosphatase PAP2 family protein [Geomonas]MBU5636591.1 phosphatase PAP2 family protein [Geomonas diazotrophica]QWV98611.1 phosphatase PAP2 family protein [Geomonas nitrogeniifigens]QXE87787.1 phosphatase PAP2 family protein [Geomonas nitrogeniifigens]